MQGATMSTSRKGLLVALFLVVTATVPLRGDVVLATESVVGLPITGSMDLLLDEPLGQIYVSSGSENNSVLVLGLDGSLIDTITGVAGAALMDLSPDGDVLWVAAPDSDEVLGYSTTTFTQVHRISMDPGHCPLSVVDLGGTLVVTGGCGKHDHPRIVDVATETVTASTGATVSNGMALHHGSWGDGVLLATMGSSPFIVYELDTGAVTPEVVEISRGPGSNLRNIVAHPDGDRVVTASGSPYVHPEYDLPGFTPSTEYQTTAYPIAAAWSADGTVFAGGSWAPADDDIHVFKDGDPVSFWTWNLTGWGLVDRGLALNSDGTVVFALTGEYNRFLHIIDVGTTLPGPPPEPGNLYGTIGHDFVEYNGGRAPEGHIDVYDAATNDYIGTWDAWADGTYQVDDLDPGVYELVFWNGQGDVLYDFFPELYREQPVLRDDLATPVVVGEGESVGVNGHLRPLFFDMFETVFTQDILWMGNTGITRGCNPPENTLYCTDDTVTRGAMAAFMGRAFGLTEGVGSVDFKDDDDSIFESDIERLAYAGITKGCNPPTNDRFCPDDPVTRGQMAAFLRRGFEHWASLIGAEAAATADSPQARSTRWALAGWTLRMNRHG